MVSRLDAEGLGVELVRLYGDLEQQFAAGVARRLAAGIDSPGWLNDKLARSGEVRNWAEQLARRVALGASIRRTIVKAFDAGANSAQQQLAGPLRNRRDHITPVQRTLPGAQAIDRLAAGLAGRLDAAGLRVARSVTDAYQQTVTAGAAHVLGGASTRRQAASQVWNRLLDQGFTGFTDVRGRNWSLAGYVDMATRTTTAQAAVAGQLDRQAQYGLDLVIVSNAPQECKRCRPWEGKILSRDGSGAGGKTLQVEHATEDRMITVRVAGSVAEAVAAGLLHPNCRHSLSAYLPGLTRVPPEGSTADPEGNKARERLRDLERQVRKAKLQEAGALTPEARAAAVQRQKIAQAKIREHVKANKHLGVKRKPEREQIDLGNRRSTAPPPAPPAPPTPRPSPPPAPRPTPPAPAPRPAAPATPPAPQLHPSAQAVTIDPSVPASQVRHVRVELDRQAQVLPRAVDSLGGVRSATQAELAAVNPNAVAYYNPGGTNARWITLGPDPFGATITATTRSCTASGWWTQCPDALAAGGHVFAHEFGHHVDFNLLRGWRNSAQVAEIWRTLAREIGVAAPQTRMVGSLTETLGLTTWFETNRAAIAALVSEYGATTSTEFIAEVWAEYVNMGPAARPAIKKLGDMIKKIAEASQ